MARADWKVKPGSFDSLNSTRLFPSGNRFGIPDLAHTSLAALPRWLVPYRARVRTVRGDLGEGTVHFFLDDYRFETVWHRPVKALAALAPYRTLLTPDFSLYRDWPLAMQVWNTYRARWCGRFWQAHGFQVIPTVSWSTPQSYAFCFAGIPPRSLVAVSYVGVDAASPLARSLFAAGFRAMVERLRPAAVLSYGPLPRALHTLVPAHTYPTRWAGIRAARKARAS